MPMLLNNSRRLIHVDGKILIPGTPLEIDEAALENLQVKALLDSKDLEVVKEPEHVGNSA